MEGQIKISAQQLYQNGLTQPVLAVLAGGGATTHSKASTLITPLFERCHRPPVSAEHNTLRYEKSESALGYGAMDGLSWSDISAEGLSTLIYYGFAGWKNNTREEGQLV